MYKLQRASSAPDPTSPYAIYPSSMFSLDLGYALWYPEPDKLTGEPQIGDVGFIMEGALVRLFNINTSRPEYRVTSWHHPFESATSPLSPDLFATDSRPGRLIPGDYPSPGVVRQETQGPVTMCVPRRVLKLLRPHSL